MKKHIAIGLFACAALASRADARWSWWLENTAETTDVSFGIATQCQSVRSLELSLLYGASPVESAFQWSVLGINNSKTDCVLQVALANIGREPGLQFGFLNVNDASAVDFGCVNVSSDAKFQLGLLNFNKKGFLSVFPFFNFDPSIFRR